MVAYSRVKQPATVAWIGRAAAETPDILDQDFYDVFGTNAPEAWGYSVHAHARLLKHMAEEPFNICNSTTDGNVLEAMRRLITLYEPCAAGAKTPFVESRRK